MKPGIHKYSRPLGVLLLLMLGEELNTYKVFFDSPFQAIAHRGGATHPDNIGHENTIAAFATAAALGYRYFETDVQLTADGKLVAFHDAQLERVSDGHGLIRDLNYSQLKTVLIGGKHHIPLLSELLEQFPTARFNIDLKAPGTGAALVTELTRLNAFDRVLITSFSRKRLAQFRKLTPQQPVYGAGTLAIAAQLAASRLHIRRNFSQAAALQVPMKQYGIKIITPDFITHAHALGLRVHVWTIDDPIYMQQLLDLGVDGIITDRPDILRQVLIQHDRW